MRWEVNEASDLSSNKKINLDFVEGKQNQLCFQLNIKHIYFI